MKLTYSILFICLFSQFLNVQSQTKNTIPISGKAYNHKYTDRTFTDSDFDTLIKLSEAFSGLPKVSSFNVGATSPPFYNYSTTEKWPAGAWGRGYEDNPDISECGGSQGEGKVKSNGDSKFYKTKYGCHPLNRDASFFLQGHIHIYLSGYTSALNEQKIKDGVDFLLNEQIKKGKNKGGYIFWFYRLNKTSVEMEKHSVNNVDDYVASHVLAVLSEYYLSKFEYKRAEVLAAINLSVKFLQDRVSWDNTKRNLLHVNNNTRGLALWALSLSYKITKNLETYQLIKKIANLEVIEQSPDGQWRTGGIEEPADISGTGKIVVLQHDQKIFYHFMALRGLVEMFSIMPDTDEYKVTIYESINKALNHVINCRILVNAPFLPESDPNCHHLLNNEFRLLYYYKADNEPEISNWTVYRDEIEKYIETLVKLTYYSKNSIFYSEQDHLYIKNLTNRMAKGLKGTNQNYIKALPMYVTYMKAINTNTSILAW